MSWEWKLPSEVARSSPLRLWKCKLDNLARMFWRNADVRWVITSNSLLDLFNSKILSNLERFAIISSSFFSCPLSSLCFENSSYSLFRPITAHWCSYFSSLFSHCISFRICTIALPSSSLTFSSTLSNLLLLSSNIFSFQTFSFSSISSICFLKNLWCLTLACSCFPHLLENTKHSY